MPLLIEGVYVDTLEKGYEAESCYYLLFQIKSVYMCINKLTEKPQKFDCEMWDNDCEFYHFYCDHLLFSLGQISNRFVYSGKEKTYKARIKDNCNNFRFSEDLFPIISNKQIRNTVEHIDEYDIDTIGGYKGVGGFNVIFDNMEAKIREAIIDTKQLHPYYFDVRSREIVVHRASKRLVVNLEQLSEELSRLRDNVLHLRSFL